MNKNFIGSVIKKFKQLSNRKYQNLTKKLQNRIFYCLFKLHDTLSYLRNVLFIKRISEC